mmetsp:Transcript_61259/g.134165  ORF Transcript_61259/g.134165 Transcript_61259/m.134165 type:complete len:110 (-) Transcript_61259:75-404(-)
MWPPMQEQHRSGGPSSLEVASSSDPRTWTCWRPSSQAKTRRSRARRTWAAPASQLCRMRALRPTDLDELGCWLDLEYVDPSRIEYLEFSVTVVEATCTDHPSPAEVRKV